MKNNNKINKKHWKIQDAMTHEDMTNQIKNNLFKLPSKNQEGE